MELVTPPSPQAAQALADQLGPRACFIAGGTVLQQGWDEPRLAPDDLCFINLQAWPETQQITLDDHHLHIGAGARLETVRTDPRVRAQAPLLSEALGQLGALGVRRLGTLGGNVGWGVGDTGPVLLVLDAEARLADGTHAPLVEVLQRPVLPLLLGFRLPRADRQPAHTAFEKVGYRAAFSPARVRVALRWARPERGLSLLRAAAGAPGTPIRRLTAVETLLGQPAAVTPDLAAVRRACQAHLPAELALMVSRLIAGHCGLL